MQRTGLGRALNVHRFRFSLRIAQAIFGAPVAHQIAQIADAHAGHFMHPDQQGGADRQPPMTYLADDRRRDLQRAGQGSIILEIHHLQQSIQQMVRIVGFLCHQCMFGHHFLVSCM